MITIIVMLILVAVTISVALNGGIFNNAKDAKDKTNLAKEKEILQTTALGYLNNDGYVDLATFATAQNNLEGYTLEKPQNKDYVIATKGTNIFYITKNGGITETLPRNTESIWLTRGLNSSNVVFDETYSCTGDAWYVDEITIYSNGGYQIGATKDSEQVKGMLEGDNPTAAVGNDYLLLKDDGLNIAIVFGNSGTLTVYAVEDNGNTAFTKDAIMGADMISQSQKTGSYSIGN